ncbi:SIT4 phosphatase-associated protein-domain-containing protein [Endogone sp. FLAS-F59071]|nr:SIT4 phosphatase-associated protein-domain-containing protein [Endogone sp. FLAS-F59071]|eukprot:RUS16783.1 SIT4 phosphatase-associated protein-domain-containing protein [Endogone sp. FLAS-F59071]
MFWRFGFHNPSAIDSLLDKDDVSLEELLDEDDLLQECKAHNQKLIDLRDPVILSQLLNYITSDELDDRQRFKYPYVACEVLSCEVWSIVEAVIENVDLLSNFWQFLDRPSLLNPLQASYFHKVIAMFLTKKTGEMLKFIRAQPNVVSKILSHLGTSAIIDLLLTLIRLEELPEGQGVVEWLSGQGLLSALVNRLDPNLDSDAHSIAQQVISEIIRMSQTSSPDSPTIGTNALITQLKSEATMTQLVEYMLDSNASNSTSTLINGVTIIIDLIRHNNSDYEVDQLLAMNQSPVITMPVNLGDMLRVLGKHVGDFQALLVTPKSVSGPVPTTMGPLVPLGFERLKVCELFAELLHCSNMSNLNIVPEEQALDEIPDNANHIEQIPATKEDIVKTTNVATEETAETSTGGPSSPMETKPISPSLANTTSDVVSPSDAVESLPNGVHESSTVTVATVDAQPATALVVPVGDFLKIKFVEHRVMPTCLDLFFNFPWNNFLHYVVYDMLHQMFNGRMDMGYNRELVNSVFMDGQLTKRIVDAQAYNDEEAAKPKGVRLGYMGHLTFISDEVVKLFERCPQEIVAVIADSVELETWSDYVCKGLRDTKERDRVPLGGARPAGHDGMDGTNGGGEEDDNEDPMEPVADGDLEKEQFHRYLSKQIAQDPLSDEEEEDEGSWMGEFERDADFDMHGAFTNSSVEGDPFSNAQGPLEEDFSVDSDDEEESANKTTDWTSAFPSSTSDSATATTGNNSNSAAWSAATMIREHKNSFDDDDEDDDTFADPSGVAFLAASRVADEGSGDNEFGGFVSSGKPKAGPNGTGDVVDEDYEDPFGRFVSDTGAAGKEVTWTSFASEFGQFDKMSISNSGSSITADVVEVQERKVDDNVVKAVVTGEERGSHNETRPVVKAGKEDEIVQEGEISEF